MKNLNIKDDIILDTLYHSILESDGTGLELRNNVQLCT
jgi:hypothetical protein